MNRISNELELIARDMTADAEMIGLVRKLAQVHIKNTWTSATSKSKEEAIRNMEVKERHGDHFTCSTDYRDDLKGSNTEGEIVNYTFSITIEDDN